MQKMTFVTAMRDYFNATPSLFTGEPIKQSPTQFLTEMKKLNDADKTWFKQQLATVGYEIAAT
jgi:hypothetical protein